MFGIWEENWMHFPNCKKIVLTGWCVGFFLNRVHKNITAQKNPQLPPIWLFACSRFLPSKFLHMLSLKVSLPSAFLYWTEFQIFLTFGKSCFDFCTTECGNGDDDDCWKIFSKCFFLGMEWRTPETSVDVGRRLPQLRLRTRHSHAQNL